jgi:hypothetical protein
MTSQEGSKEIETKYIAHGLRPGYQNRAPNDPIDCIKNDRYISIKTLIASGKLVMLAGISGVLVNMRKQRYEHHILHYEHVDGLRKHVRGLTVIDFSGLYEQWVSPEILEEIRELCDCVKSHNGRHGAPLLPEDDEIYGARIKHINGMILAKSGLRERVFSLTKCFDRTRRTYRIHCYLHSVERFLKHYPEKLIYSGLESECGFDVRQLVVNAKPRKISRSQN